ncbi:MAG: diguanylate cyclase [Magnetococcales bacterium]|nr:diguanylate cyclase [Magnetococcales bacterium]
MGPQSVTQPSELLLLTPSATLGKEVSQALFRRLGIRTSLAGSLDAALSLLEQYPLHHFLCVVDLEGPAPIRDLLDPIQAHGIPILALLPDLHPEKRITLLEMKVYDYLQKSTSLLIDWLVASIRAFQSNSDVFLLIVEPNVRRLQHLQSLLRPKRFHLLGATSAREAMELLQQHPGIQGAILSWHAGDMDGPTLCHSLRKKMPERNLFLIGITSRDHPLLSACFLKSGADDFLMWPVESEEISCRIDRCLGHLQKEQSGGTDTLRDHVTGLANRRFAMESGMQLFASARRSQIGLGLCLLEIDRFQVIHELYGLKAGDRVMQRVAELIRRHFRDTDLVARFSENLFLVFLVNMLPEKAEEHLLLLNQFLTREEIPLEGRTVQITASLGASFLPVNSLEELFDRAETLLKEAKRRGGNQVQLEW